MGQSFLEETQVHLYYRGGRSQTMESDGMAKPLRFSSTDAGPETRSPMAEYYVVARPICAGHD